MSRWFRFYGEALNDPKVQSLPGDLFKTWVNLLCVASQHGGQLPSKEALSLLLRRRSDHFKRDINELVKRGLIDLVGDVMSPHKWSERQYKSDASAPRTRSWRERHRDVTCDASVTPPDNRVQNTDTEKKDSRGVAQRAPADKARGTRLADDWQPTAGDIEAMLKRGYSREHLKAETEKFKNFWLAKAGAAARKVDWPRTWINWILNSKTNGGFNGPRPAGGARRPAGDDFFAGLAAVAQNIAGDGGVAGPATEEVPLGRVNIDG